MFKIFRLAFLLPIIAFVSQNPSGAWDSQLNLRRDVSVKESIRGKQSPKILGSRLSSQMFVEFNHRGAHISMPELNEDQKSEIVSFVDQAIIIANQQNLGTREILVRRSDKENLILFDVEMRVEGRRPFHFKEIPFDGSDALGNVHVCFLNAINLNMPYLDLEFLVLFFYGKDDEKVYNALLDITEKKLEFDNEHGIFTETQLVRSHTGEGLSLELAIRGKKSYEVVGVAHYYPDEVIFSRIIPINESAARLAKRGISLQVQARRNLIFKVLNKQSEPITVDQLWILMKQEPGYENLVKSTMAGDLPKDNFLWFHAKLTINKRGKHNKSSLPINGVSEAARLAVRRTLTSSV